MGKAPFLFPSFCDWFSSFPIFPPLSAETLPAPTRRVFWSANSYPFPYFILRFAVPSFFLPVFAVNLFTPIENIPPFFFFFEDFLAESPPHLLVIFRIAVRTPFFFSLAPAFFRFAWFGQGVYSPRRREIDSFGFLVGFDIIRFPSSLNVVWFKFCAGSFFGPFFFPSLFNPLGTPHLGFAKGACGDFGQAQKVVISLYRLCFAKCLFFDFLSASLRTYFSPYPQ